MKNNILKKIKTVYYVGSTNLLFLMTGTFYVKAASTISPEAPLQIIQDAQSKAKSTSLNTDSIQSNVNLWAGILAMLCGLGGLIYCGVSATKLWKATQDEQSRESIGRSIGGFIIGAAISMLVLVVGAITTGLIGG